MRYNKYESIFEWVKINMIFLLKGILIGLVFGMPVGAIGAMTIHRTLTKDFWAGVITGMGSSVADCTYAAIGAFGVTFISSFLLANEFIISIIGAIVILAMGIARFFQKTSHKEAGSAGCGDGIKMFISAFSVAIMNPVLIMSFMVAFTTLGLVENISLAAKLAIVFGVFIGTWIWWGILLAAVEYIKRKKGGFNMMRMNQVFGVVFIIFAVVIIIKAFM